MKPWIIDRIERRREDEAYRPVPLRIQPPPPEWIEQKRREQEPEQRRDRGVTIIGDEDERTDRGVVIIDL